MMVPQRRVCAGAQVTRAKTEKVAEVAMRLRFGSSWPSKFSQPARQAGQRLSVVAQRRAELGGTLAQVVGSGAIPLSVEISGRAHRCECQCDVSIVLKHWRAERVDARYGMAHGTRETLGADLFKHMFGLLAGDVKRALCALAGLADFPE